ncbi:hypothetical protein PV325_007814 [Microctonus aethiopoides]|nr:hypothetical protein PV325_007814 [Microctonus aethiopoides]
MNGENIPLPHPDANNNGKGVDNNELVISSTDDSNVESVVANIISPNNMLKVTKRDVIFQRNLCYQIKNQFTAGKANETIGKELSGEGKVQIYQGCGFFMQETILNLIHLRYSLDKEWKHYVREVLLKVYENQLSSYTTEGSRGTPHIAVQLFRGLHQRINCDRLAGDYIPETKLVKYINATTSNKRQYQNILKKNKKN